MEETLNSQSSCLVPIEKSAQTGETFNFRCDRIAAPWGPTTPGPDTEWIFRKEFEVEAGAYGTLFITAQGVYEAEINGHRVGDHFMAPGWTAYGHRIPYQAYDITSLLIAGKNCIGVRVAEGWFCGRIGFEGGHRNIWGPHPALMCQLQLRSSDIVSETISTDSTWLVTRGPIQRAEIYNGEKYDATREVPYWSTVAPNGSTNVSHVWLPVLCMPPMPKEIELTTGFGEPIRRIETIKPFQHIVSPSGKSIIDFGQNMVGYVRLSNIKGPRGHKIILSHAEVLEKQELCTRPLRICDSIDEYILKGDNKSETYEPRFTFHGFRYAQIEGWSSDFELMDSVEAVVCHTDMREIGSFSCSEKLLNQLYQNIRWGMKGNFLGVPTDCPQRDERLGWSGDLALFAPTALLIFDCYEFLRDWLLDVWYDQQDLDGVPAMVTPNATLPDPVWCRRKPCAIWHDVTILAPWALYEETGNIEILEQQYESMETWLNRIPRRKDGSTHLWDTDIFQLGDWLDPDAPPDAPWKGKTDAQLVANAFLIHSLGLMVRIADLLHKDSKLYFEKDLEATRIEFHAEYVTPNGRLVSDSQAAYSIAICFGLLAHVQQERAASRLVYLVKKSNFRIGTGFAGTPFLCEALALTGHIQVAYAMLLEQSCPSWLFPVTMGATTMWERWDSMLPDGSINSGNMTSFNHYAFGSIAKFLYERVAGLQRLEPGWKKFRFAPCIGAELSDVSASHDTPVGLISCSWKTTTIHDKQTRLEARVAVPRGMICEVILPNGGQDLQRTVAHGEWKFETTFVRDYEWPLQPLPPKS